jgi:hypothetical protein
VSLGGQKEVEGKRKRQAGRKEIDNAVSEQTYQPQFGLTQRGQALKPVSIPTVTMHTSAFPV